MYDNSPGGPDGPPPPDVDAGPVAIFFGILLMLVGLAIVGIPLAWGLSWLVTHWPTF